MPRLLLCMRFPIKNLYSRIRLGKYKEGLLLTGDDVCLHLTKGQLSTCGNDDGNLCCCLLEATNFASLAKNK